ncbi:MAG: flavin reductase [Bacilli bacterium]|jgi:flavin reductase (DIM6/NTAB) family NADH-FMN oxidoreductase RutF
MESLLQGVNIVAYKKNNKMYGMTCAWATHVDYKELILLLGSQSDTGNNLEVGDIIGVSSLGLKNKDLALHFGEKHSSSFDKFKGIKYTLDGNAILFPNTHTNFVCEVIKVSHPLSSEEDNLVEAKVLSEVINNEAKFLSMDDMN